MKKIFIIIFIVVIALISLSLVKNMVAKTIISTGVKAMTGLDLKMRSFKVGVFNSLIDIKDLKLFNPAGFSDRLMVDLPEIYVDYDLGAFFRKKVHLETVRLVLKEFIVIKNKDGELNLDSLKSIKGTKEEKEKKPTQKKKAPKLQIDVLELKIGKVIYKDYSKGTEPSVKEFNVNINAKYKNITNPRTFANLIVMQALMKTTIANLTNFDPRLLTGELDDVAGKASELLKDTTGVALDATKDIGDTAKETTEKTIETIKNILPFGK